MNRQNGKRVNEPLSKYARTLKQMAKKGQIDLPMDDELAEIILTNLEPVELTEDEMKKLSLGLYKAHQNKAIEQARVLLPKRKQSFGRHLQFLRLKAGPSVVEIARRLKMERSYLENIEAGWVNPMEIAREKIADIMELFRISLSEFVEIVKNSLVLVQVKTGEVKMLARSSSQVGSKERATGVSYALDAALIEIAKKKGQIPEESIQVNEEYLKGIREELIKRNRADLLT